MSHEAASISATVRQKITSQLSLAFWIYTCMFVFQGFVAQKSVNMLPEVLIFASSKANYSVAAKREKAGIQWDITQLHIHACIENKTYILHQLQYDTKSDQISEFRSGKCVNFHDLLILDPKCVSLFGVFIFASCRANTAF